MAPLSKHRALITVLGFFRSANGLAHLSKVDSVLQAPQVALESLPSTGHSLRLPYCMTPTFPINTLEEAASPAKAGYRLAQVQVLTRHGARTASEMAAQTNKHNYTTELPGDIKAELAQSASLFSLIDVSSGGPSTRRDEFGDKFLPAGLRTERDPRTGQQKLKPGALTALGFRQEMDLGRRMREVYGGPLANGLLANLTADDIYARTTPIGRTCNSAVSLLTGLLHGEWERERVGNRYQIMVDDYLEEPMVAKSCSRAKSMDDASVTEIITENIDKGLADQVVTPLCDGASLPCLPEEGCLDEARVQSIMGKANRAFCQRFTTGAGAQAELLYIWPFVQEIVDRLRQREVHTASHKFVLYSAHDSVLTPVAAAFGFYDCKWVPLASHIVFELWTLPGSPSAVRVLFNGAPQLIKGCEKAMNATHSFLCPLDLLEDVVQGLLGGSASYRDACEI